MSTRRERPTIMDGKVVDFAEDWHDEGPGIFGRKESPVGPYHVSASRNAIVVHRGTQLTSTTDVEKFIAAIREAHAEAIHLRTKDRGSFSGDLPTDSTVPADLTTALHLLRNPWGHTEAEVRGARLWAADQLEAFQRQQGLTFPNRPVVPVRDARFDGSKNRYHCSTCGKDIITLDVDDGTTPFIIQCRATPGCEGRMQSQMYKNVGDAPPGFVWRKPTPEEYKAAGPMLRQHFDQGGLDLYVLEAP